MATFTSFEEIQAWQEGRKLVCSIRAICKRPVVKSDFIFIDQVTRAARSIPANIAEGYEAMSDKEFVKFLGYAKRSAGELRSHFYDALEENYINQEEFDALSVQAKAICGMLGKVIRYLQSAPSKYKHTYAQ